MVFITPMHEDARIGYSLFEAGIVASIFIVIGALTSNALVVILAMSSLLAIVTVFCIAGSLGVVAGLSGFMSLMLAVAAALIVKRDGSKEPLYDLFLSALPVIGALRYLSDVFDKKVDGVMKR